MGTKEELLQMISKKTGKSTEELEKELSEIKASQKEQMPPDYPEDKLSAQSLARLRATYRKQLSSRAEEITGVIIGSMRKIDMVRKKRASALEEYRRSPEESIAKGIVDSEGNPLEWETNENFAKLPIWARDRRFKVSPNGPIMFAKDGQETRWIGNPVPENDWSRNVFGAAKRDEKWVKFSLRLRGDNCDISVPTFCISKFSALKLQSSTEGLLKFNDISEMRFQTVKELEDMEAQNLLKLFSNINLSQLDAWVNNPDNRQFGAFTIINAIVTEIVPNVTPTGMQIISIEDDTVDFTDEQGNIVPAVGAFLLPHIPLNFSEKADVWLVGQPSITQDKEGNPRKSITVYGVFVPKIYRKSIEQEIPKEGEW